MRREDQTSVAAWARETFGPVSDISAAARANEEMAELLAKIAAGGAVGIGGEIADVVICLYRLCDNRKLNLQNEIEKKMAINRSRKWELDGSGCGYHAP